MKIAIIVSLFIPTIQKVFFWIYLIQLKEYRFDRLREFFGTTQWKKSIINKLFFIEVFFIFFTFIVFLFKLNYIFFYLFIFFLFIQNIFIFWKIYKKQILIPKFTFRVKLSIITTIVIFFSILFWIYSLDIGLFVFLISIFFSFFYIFVLISNAIISPIANIKKNKKIQTAITKTKNIQKPIKIWITGSFGKSSVKEYLSYILSKEWKLLKTPKNTNTEMWISDIVITKLDDSYDYFVAEMWAYRIWEIMLLWKIVNHKYWFLTWIWNQHIWLFGWIENTKIAKFEISQKVLKNDWVLYLNYDNEHIRSINIPEKLNIVRYGLENKSCDIVSDILIQDQNWSIFETDYKWKKIKFQTKLLWNHNILNLVWVIAFCIDIWIDIKKIQNHISKINPPSKTLEIAKKSIFIWNKKINLTTIDDTYNLSENGLFAWIQVLENFKNCQKVLILDDILELWKQAKKIHFDIGLKIAKSNIDKILFVWINYKDEFIKWLLSWWFLQQNILNDILICEDSVILFEWRRSAKFLENINKK